MDQRILRLKEKHAAVEAELAEEMARPSPDLIRVARMKRHKLWLRDLMSIQRAALTGA
jgi:hypothetical protein